MPIIKSAEKKLRQAKVKTSRNRVVRERLHSLIVAFRKSPSEQDLPKVISALGKAAKARVIHKNKVSRLSARLSKLVAKPIAKTQSAVKKSPGSKKR